MDTYQTGCGRVYGASLGLYSCISMAALLSDAACASLKWGATVELLSSDVDVSPLCSKRIQRILLITGS